MNGRVLKSSSYFAAADRLRQVGQTFFIDNLETEDFGKVRCYASKGNITLDMIKGILYVNLGRTF